MPKTSHRTQETDLEIRAANAGLLAPTAVDIVLLFENGDADEATARIRALGQADYIKVMRVITAVERALSAYAGSWQGAFDWGNGTPFPDEQETAKAASA